MKIQRTIMPVLGLLAGVGALSCSGSLNVEAEATFTIACEGDCLCEEASCECEASGACDFAGEDGQLPDDANIACELENDCGIDCGAHCDIKCAGNSTCVIAAGDDSVLDCEDSSCDCEAPEAMQVTCTGNSTCALTLGPGSGVLCTGNTDCMLDCPSGDCDIDCDGSATCSLGCPAGDCSLACDDGDPVECADGRLACPSECVGAT